MFILDRKAVDIIYFKESVKPLITARSKVKFAKYYHDLTPISVKLLMKKYQQELQVSNEYIESKLESRYATLIWLEPIEKIIPFSFIKHDQRAWIPNFMCEELKIRGD